MAHPRVLCLGEILLDLLADQVGQPLERVETWTPYPGGAPANVACALAKLGTPSGFIGCVGEDSPGDQLLQLLRAEGVDTLGVQRHPTAPTRQVYVVRESSGERHFAGFGDHDTREFADTHLQATDLPIQLFETADFLVLGTLELAYPDTRNSITHALQLAEQYNIKVLVDVNWRPVFWSDPDTARETIQKIFQHVDFIKLSDEEADWLFGTTDPGVITHRLETVEGVLVTASERGCAYCLGGNEGKLPAFSVSAIDATGAGDGFVAGFVHQLNQFGIQCLTDAAVAQQALTYACAVGAMTTLKPGAIAAQPTAAEVEEFLKLHPAP